MSEATNLIFIMSDEHNKRVLGCAGHPMIKTLTSVAFGLALIGFAPAAFAADNNPAVAAAGTYKNDPLHTSVTAKISHSGGLSNFTFRFTKTDISYTYDPAKPADTKVTAVIGTASVAAIPLPGWRWDFRHGTV